MATRDRAARLPGPPQGSMGCLFLAMGALGILGLFGVVLAGVIGATSAGTETITEVIVETSPTARTKLAIIDVRGVLVESGVGGFAGRGVTEATMAMLQQARDDDSVGGVLLRLDTPGGSVTDADLIHNRLKALREKNKKIVVLMGDVCASGGYYVAVAADAIYALPTTITGSIGVIIAGLNVHELLQRHGVRDTSVMSGDMKSLLSSTRAFDPAKRALLQNIVDRFHKRFVDLILKSRGEIDADRLAEIADGRIMTADEALDLKMIDEIGYRKSAIEKLRALVGKGPYTLVRYQARPSLMDLMGWKSTLGTSEATLAQWFLAAPRAMYILSPLGR